MAVGLSRRPPASLPGLLVHQRVFISSTPERLTFSAKTATSQQHVPMFEERLRLLYENVSLSHSVHYSSRPTLEVDTQYPL